jgi:hypothetical protein
MSLKKRIGLLGLALIAVGQSGCLVLGATAAGGGVVGVAYLAGKTTRVVDASLDETSVALGSALRDLGLPIEDSHGTAARAEVEARLANGEPVHIDLDLQPRAFASDPPRTKIGVRVATFGDDKLSNRILDQVEERLRNPAPPPPPGTQPLAPHRVPETSEPPLAK